MRISDWSSDVCSSDLRLYEFAGQFARLLDGNALSQRVAFAGKVLTPYIGVHRRIKLRLHANQADIGFQGARCSAHARKEPTAADGNDQRVDLRRVLQHFKRDGALSGDEDRQSTRLNSSH